MSGELGQLLDEWKAELEGREARLPIFLRMEDNLAYQLEYARVSMLQRHIGALADVIARTPALRDAQDGTP